MKWLNKLEYYGLSFKIETVYKNDCIIADKKRYEYKILIILDGFMQKVQNFTNGEAITLKLLYSADLFTNIKPETQSSYANTNYYYQFKALTDTTIIVLNTKELEKKTESNYYQQYLLSQIHNQENNEMIQILSHKNIKKRIIQLLLILIKHFGKISKNHIHIPFGLSQQSIAIIIGSQRVTVNRIMSKFKRNTLYYDNKKIIIFNMLRLIQS